MAHMHVQGEDVSARVEVGWAAPLPAAGGEGAAATTATTTLVKTRGQFYAVCAAFFLIGTASWSLLTALFAQCAYFILALPEGYQIYAYVDVATETGNIVPFLLVLLFATHRLNGMLAGVLVTVAVVVALLLAVGWRVTVGGSSTVVLAGAWFSGAVGSTSMICFFGFAQQYGTFALTAMSVGIGACGLITNILGIIQGLPKLKEATRSHAGNSSLDWAAGAAPSSSNDPQDLLLFGPSTYFVALLVWLCFAVAAYAVLICGPLSHLRMKPSYRDGERAPLLETAGATGDKDGDTNDNASWSLMQVIPRTRELVQLLLQHLGPNAAIFWSCVTEFAVPSLVPYVIPCGPDHESESFWLTVVYLTGSLLGRIATMRFHNRSFLLLNGVQTALFVYALVVARVAHPLPAWISYIVFTSFSACHGFLVTEVFLELGHSERLTAIGGLSNQAGALMGSVLSFVLIKMSVIQKRTC